MSKNNNEFYSATISGAEFECKFAFPKIYFTKNPADKYTKIYYDIGFLEDIGWSTSNSATPKFNLTAIDAIDIYAGMEITEGQMTFKVFHHDSFEKLKEVILEGINHGKDKMKFPEIYDSPFLSLDLEWEKWEFHNDHTKINWGQMPLFDIILIVKNKNENNEIEVRKKVLEGVALSGQGSSVAINSTEISAFASFMSIGKITDWEKYEGND